MTIRDLLLKAYWRLEGMVTPGLRYSQSEYEEVLAEYVDPNTAWLDLGCGRRLLPDWRSDAERRLIETCETVVGVDVDHAALTENESIRQKCLASATQLPFADDSFTLVTANMVVEHLDDPATQFGEVSRVMKPGGVFICHTPNAAGYPTRLARLIPGAVKSRLAHLLDGRHESDVYPTLYRANSRAALEQLARAHSLRVRELRLIVTSAVFALVLPVALLELIWLRLLMMERLEGLRTNIIAVFEKLESGAAPHEVAASTGKEDGLARVPSD